MKGLLFDGMNKIQLPGMEGLPANQAVVGIIEKIAGQWVSDMLHVNPDLMGSSRLQAQLY